VVERESREVGRAHVQSARPRFTTSTVRSAGENPSTGEPTTRARGRRRRGSRRVRGHRDRRRSVPIESARKNAAMSRRVPRMTRRPPCAAPNRTCRPSHRPHGTSAPRRERRREVDQPVIQRQQAHVHALEDEAQAKTKTIPLTTGRAVNAASHDTAPVNSHPRARTPSGEG